jgi:hypothetical protein
MAFAAKLLAEGQVASSKGAIYTVPGSAVAYIKSIQFYNTNALTQTLNVYLNGSGTSRQMHKIELEQDESAVISHHITLQPADTIEAVTDTAAAVDFTVHGVEEV